MLIWPSGRRTATLVMRGEGYTEVFWPHPPLILRLHRQGSRRRPSLTRKHRHAVRIAAIGDRS
jgi:hypothetical protein